MTNEELAVRIQTGEADLMAALWEQVNLYAFKRAKSFFYRNHDRCLAVGLELDDITQEAYLGIYMAAQHYEAASGVKFLTYAEYHLKNRFYTAVKYRCRHSYSETSFEIVLLENEDGALAKLSDTLIDPDAESKVYDFIEQDYQKDYQIRLKKAVSEALRCLLQNQRETVLACFGRGISFSGYARQKGISKQVVHETGTRAMKKLRNSSALAALWAEGMMGVA